MPPFIDYTNKQINNWNILAHEGFNKHGESVWTAVCNCKHTTKIKRPLSRIKRSKRCRACANDIRIENQKSKQIGQTYGKLTIVDYYGYRDDVKTTSSYWIARCDCGSEKEIIATLYDIKNKRIASCGCLKDEYNKKYSQYNGAKRKKYNEFIEKDDYYVGVSSNGVFLFDKDDYEKVLAINRYWSINNIGYVLCKIQGKEYQLHRYLMGLGFYNPHDDIIVDHINGDTLDNRKTNLRIIHRKHNAKNCALYSNNTSGYKGVSWLRHLNKWQADIQVNKQSIYLGVYDDLDEAVEVRKAAEIKYFGKYSRDYGDEVIN